MDGTTQIQNLELPLDLTPSEQNWLDRHMEELAIRAEYGSLDYGTVFYA